MKKTISFALLLVLGATSVSYASIDKNLKYGQRDKEVTELQEFLIDGGFLNGTPTTFFGLLTLKAVKAYQKSVSVSPTGYVGVLTRQKINDTIASETASSTQAEVQETGTTTVIQNTNKDIVKVVTVQATTTPLVDLCKNIEGVQTKVPDGMYLDNNSICFTPVVNQNTNTQTNYQTQASNQNNTQATVTPVPSTPKPTCTLSIEQIPRTETAKVSWTSTNAQSGFLNGVTNLWDKIMINGVDVGNTIDKGYRTGYTVNYSTLPLHFVAEFSGIGGKVTCEATLNSFTPVDPSNNDLPSLSLSASSPTNPTGTLADVSNGLLIAKLVIKVNSQANNNSTYKKFAGFKYIDVISDDFTKADLTLTPDNGFPPLEQEYPVTTVVTPLSEYSETTFNVYVSSTTQKTGKFKLRIKGIEWASEYPVGYPVGLIQTNQGSPSSSPNPLTPISVETPVVTITN